MVNPFHYPKARHTRRLHPPAYTHYRKYKPELREEFEGQCVYCRMLDAVKGRESFGVDHYRPKKHFPHLATEYFNLFYSCNRCNTLKRDFWPSPKNEAEGRFVPNPCEHVMFDHLRYRGGDVDANSNAGEWTIDLLLLNDTLAVTFREAYIKALDLMSSQLTASKATAAEAERQLAKGAASSDSDRLATLLKRAEDNVKSLEDQLKSLLGK